MMLSHPDWLCTIHAQSPAIRNLLKQPASQPIFDKYLWLTKFKLC